MADEVSVRILMTVTKGELSERFDESFHEDMAGSVLAAGVQDVGTTHEALSLGDVSTAGPIVLQNLDSANYVEIGLDQTGSFVPVTKIPAGACRLIQPASGVTLYVKANTAAVKLKRLIPST